MQGIKGGSHSSLPSQPLQGVGGRGATSSASEGGSERAGHLPKAMQHSRDQNPKILDCPRSGQSLSGCVTPSERSGNHLGKQKRASKLPSDAGSG